MSQTTTEGEAIPISRPYARPGFSWRSEPVGVHVVVFICLQLPMPRGCFFFLYFKVLEGYYSKKRWVFSFSCDFPVFFSDQTFSRGVFLHKKPENPSFSPSHRDATEADFFLYFKVLEGYYSKKRWVFSFSCDFPVFFSDQTFSRGVFLHKKPENPSFSPSHRDATEAERCPVGQGESIDVEVRIEDGGSFFFFLLFWSVLVFFFNVLYFGCVWNFDVASLAFSAWCFGNENFPSLTELICLCLEGRGLRFHQLVWIMIVIVKKPDCLGLTTRLLKKIRRVV